LKNKSLKWLWPIILIATSVVIVVLFLGNVHFFLRPIIALWFLLVCPGMAIVRIFTVHDNLLEWVMAMALSISLAGIFSTIQIYIHAWSPVVVLLILAGITVLGAIIQLRNSHPGASSQPAEQPAGDQTTFLKE
jgi:uncharacterized membrane protein